MGVVKHNVTDEQILDALLESNGVKSHAAKTLGMSRSTYNDRLGKVNNGLTAEAPAGYNIKGISAYQTLIDGEWVDTRRWVKTDKQKENLDALQDALEARFSKCKAAPRVKAPKRARDGLLTVYPMGDPHIGMLAHQPESGEDFDLKIAERNLVGASNRLIEAAHNGPAMIVNVGDFFHADNDQQKTERSGHKLSVDTRYCKILEVGVDLMCTIIGTALEKHSTVHVINARGNHDPQSAMVLTIALKHHFRNNPRVTFCEPSSYFHYHQHGKVLLGVTHGDGPKPTDLGEIMAADEKRLWGETRHRYWITGHIHTRSVYELRGCVVESFRTLAAKDAWTAQMGYRSGRDMYRIVYDKEHGEVERQRVDISMLTVHG